MNEENKRKAIILTFIGALTLLFVVVGGTFAYFQLVDTSKGSTNTNFETATDDLNKYGTPLLTKKSDLYINLSASDMAYSKGGTSYWATEKKEPQEKNYEEERKNHVISTASIERPDSEDAVEDAYLKCTSELTITITGEMKDVLETGDGTLYLGTTSSEGNSGSIEPESFDLADLVSKQESGENKVTVNYTIVGYTSIDVTADVEIVNKANKPQNLLAGTDIKITITNNNLSCSVSEKPVYAKVDNTNVIPPYNDFGKMYKSYDYYDKIEKVSFVDYIPSEEELSSLTHWDLSDTASGTLENSVIGWIEKSGNKGYSFDNDADEMDFTNTQVDLYNLYIGSNSKIYIKDLSHAFEYLVNLKNVDFSNLNTSETTDMNSMFLDCRSLTSLDLSTFDTSKITDMSWMFWGITVDLPFQNWPNFITSSVTDMNHMFTSYQGKTLNLSSFDTSKVTDMSFMFFGVSADLPFKDWPNFVTSSVTNMSNMFSAYKGTELDLSTFDTSQVTDMSRMFHANVSSGSGNLIKITFSDKYSTPKLINTSMMFYDQKKLTEINFGNFTFDNVTDVSRTFDGVSSDCTVTIKRSQQATFESKFSYNFTPKYVD